MQVTQENKDRLDNLGTFIPILGVATIFVALLALPAAVGCFLRKSFGKILSIATGAIALLVGLTGAMVLYKYLPTKVDDTDRLTTAIVPVVAYGGYAFIAMIGGFLMKFPASAVSTKSKSRKGRDDDDRDDDDQPRKKPAGRKSPRDDDDRDDDDDDDQPRKKPAGRKSPRDDDDEDDDDQPRKKPAGRKSPRDDDDEDDDDQPRKKRRRNDDD